MSERCGELLRQIESGQGKVNQHTVLRDGADLKQPTRESVATAAGLSARWKHVLRASVVMMTTAHHRRYCPVDWPSIAPTIKNRDATPGQKAMAFAMQWPDGLQRGRGNCSQIREQLTKTQENLISKARYVLRNSPMVEGERYPRRCLDVMNGLISLTEAYELAQQDFRNRAEKERIDQEIAAKRADLESRYPDLAALVAEDRLSLSKAIAVAEQARVPV